MGSEDSSALQLEDGIYDLDVPWRGMIRQSAGVMTAGGFPVKPPSDWFKQPDVDRLTPLTVSNTGRVFGHIAAWHTSHIGMAGGVKPPRSKSGYAFFQTGVVETDDGSMVPCGQITLAGGHAPLDVDVARAVAHYDDTNSAIMDVAAGEDQHGIWVAGALRPSVSDEQIRSIRASSVSGDWRPINGRLELVAVCAVNCPGFPIPRARVASGTPIALIAAGVEPLVELSIADRVDEGIALGLEMFRERVRRVEEALISSGYGESSDMQTQLRKRVHKAMTSDSVPDPAALRARVHPDAVAAAGDLRKKVHAPVVASLRDRVHSEPPPFDDGLVAASGYSTSQLEAMLAKGTAFKNNAGEASWPTPNLAYLKRAVQAWGRSANVDRPALKRYLLKRARALKAGKDTLDRISGLTASAAPEPIDNLRARAHGLTAAFNSNLHPRGKDGKFIEIGGFVSGLFHLDNGKTEHFDRVKVTSTPNTKSPSSAGIPKGVHVIVDVPGSKNIGPIWANPKDIVQVASPKGHLGGIDEKVWRSDFDKVHAKIPADAIVDFGDGTSGIDPSKVSPDVLSLYNKLLQVGYAQGFIASGAAPPH